MTPPPAPETGASSAAAAVITLVDVKAGNKEGTISLATYPACPPVADSTHLLLAHGAGLSRTSPFMLALARALTARGFPVTLFNFPYMEREGRRPPDRQPLLLAAWRAALGRLGEHAPPGTRVILGGKSMGGRMASVLAAEEPTGAGLVYFGYPLHPAGKPENLRAEHLGRIALPQLFVQGSRDPLARLPLLEPVVRELPRGELYLVQDGDHSLEKPRRHGISLPETLADVAEHVAGWAAAF